MGDAEIIPIGTRGRPGRGTGTQPSSAARSLAPKSAAPKSASRPQPAKTDEPKPKPSPHPGAPSRGRADPRRRSRPTTRAPDGIPAGDWLAAQHAAARSSARTGSRSSPASWPSCAAGSPATTSVDEYGFDQEITERFLMAALRPIAEKWFRIEVRGLENIPAEGGALVVSNHSGTIPVDGLMTMVSIHDHTGRFLRPLGADLVFRLPVVGSLARKGGATLACNEDAERMLSGGELVGVWPEGFKGIGKPFSERYKLQRFGRGGFVSAALRTGVPIVPLSVVGAEEIYPMVGNLPSLARLLGLPYIPITPFFPLLGPLGLVPLPSKWLLEFGEPIRTDDFDAGAADDPMLVFNVTDQVRETIQQTLYSLLMQRDSVFR